MIKITVMIPNTSSSVNSIFITSPHREGKKEIICFPVDGKQPPPFMALSGYPKISLLLYHIICISSTLGLIFV